jgi:O-antigen/teichoic acid export membrane protein
MARSSEMKISRRSVVKGAGWTVGAYGAGQLLRLITNVVLARLLAPELFGIMVIVNSVRTGVELSSDVGIGQNVVQNPNAEEPDFYNTAWSLQLIRGLLLWLLCFPVAMLLTNIYQAPILGLVLPIAGLSFLIAGLSSIGQRLLQKRLRFAALNIFEFLLEVVSSAAHVILALISPTIWALVLGALTGPAARMVGSYFLVPGLRNRFYISKRYARQILAFGKWIFLSSIVYFLSSNFDRLYLGKIIPLDVLGVYGIARTVTDVLGLLVNRLGNIVVFPLISSSFDMPRHQLREQLVLMRLIFLAVAAVGLAFFAATGDLLVELLYDQRYQAAGWMLPVLIIGVWFSAMCSLNESTLLGFGKPSYGTIANCVKLCWLVVGLPVGFMKEGVLGAVVAVAVSDVFRYAPILVGQIRERFSFGIQDLCATILMFAALGFWQWLRWSLELGTSFDHLPTFGAN